MVTNTTIKKGYKQTELGVIPSDWEVKTLKEVAKFRRGSFPQPYGLDKWYDDYLGAPFVQVYDVDDNFKLKDETKRKISKEAQKMSVHIPKGSVILTIQGSIGRIAITQYDAYVDRTLLLFESFLVPFDKYFFLLSVFLLFEKEKESAPGGIIKTITKEALSSFTITYPKTSEQTAIATVIFDTNNLIEYLNKLIAKKKAIKQGAMQQLLTGRKRLPGFSGEWKVKKLGDFLDYEQPTEYLVTDTEYNDNNSTPVLTAGKTFILGYTNEEHGIFNKLPVIIFDDFTTAIKFVDFPFKAKSSAMKMLVPKNNKVNMRFIYEIMLQIKYPLGDHKRHWIGEYQHLEITVPASPEEQIAIATILSDMDIEIKNLEQKRDKYIMLKQGMMQQLLTGKIRIYANN